MKKNILLLIAVLVLGIMAYVVYQRSTPSTLANKPLTNFAIDDTASVTKIIITDHFGRVAKVERITGNKLWRLNDKYYAREDAVETLLKTFKRIRVRGNVSVGGRDNMMKLLATSGKRCEIFTGGDKPEKIYYVGVATPDHTGTIMLLEIPGIGRSEEPYVTHMDGFTGFLSTRFFADENEWRYTGVYDYPTMDFNSVQVIHHNEPQESFEVKYHGGNSIELYSEYNAQTKTFNHRQEQFDSLSIKDLLMGFKKLHVESYTTGLKQFALDSLSLVQPTYSLILTDNKGQVKKTDLYLRLATKEEFDMNGNPTPWDQARFWARTPDGEFASAQTFNFGVLVWPLKAYLPAKK
jgi:hypothetical protein